MNKTAAIRIFCLAAIACFVLPLHAQLGSKKGVSLKHPMDFRQSHAVFTNNPLPLVLDEATAVRQYLEKHYPHLSSGSLKLVDIKQSPGGNHYTFEQHYGAIALFDAQVKVNLDKAGVVKSVFDNGYDTHDWNKTLLNKGVNTISGEGYLNTIREQYGWSNARVDLRTVIAVVNASPMAAAEVKVFVESTYEYRLWLLDESGEAIYSRDLNAYQQDTAAGNVFLPDPLTTAQKNYGTPYNDNADNDANELNNERKPVELYLTLNNNTYLLENDYVKIVDVSQPTAAPAEEILPIFDYTRSQSFFEDANAFYHITEYKGYVESLGFSALGDFQIQVDPHALNGDDNSLFSPASTPPRLLFGEGGVDDAEDADVVIHEYGHGLSYSAAPNTNSGFERQALDEAFCDYIATSYSRNISAFNWQNMFTWDGHNEYWNGRNTASSKTYPDGLSGSLHESGEIWSSMMMELWEQLGRTKTDRLALQSLFSYAQNMSLADAAMVLLQADTALYNGDNFCTIYPILHKRGLVDTTDLSVCIVLDPSIMAKAGADQVTCQGDSIQIGDPNAITSGRTYSWAPMAGLGNPNSPAPRAAPSASISYTLTVSTVSGSYNTDGVIVEVVPCNINLLNTDNFAMGTGNAIINLPFNTNSTSIEVFDATGKRFLNFKDLPGTTLELAPGLFPAGVYIIRIQTDTSDDLCTKLVRIK